MDITQIAIMSAILLFTVILWGLMLFTGRRQTWMVILTVAVTIGAALAVLNVAGVVEIWNALSPAVATP